MRYPLIGKKLIFLNEVDSTNNYAAKLFRAGEIDSGTVILAEKQTNGRGQRGNHWKSLPNENLLMSFPIDLTIFNHFQLPSLNHFISLGIHDFLTTYSNKAHIKWPNDLVIEHRKIAGILIETQIERNAFNSAIIGIGININQTHFDEKGITSLQIETGHKHDIKTCLKELIYYLNQRVEQLFGIIELPLKNHFEKKLWLLNQTSSFKYRATGECFIGVILGTTEQGALLMRIEDEEKIIQNGEILFLERIAK
jgi:BirA family biotin operon repressor/biotin-[acetyl-CoA-carboxylase] ligase